jgi:hypothetical protein
MQPIERRPHPAPPPRQTPSCRGCAPPRSALIAALRHASRPPAARGFACWPPFRLSFLSGGAAPARAAAAAAAAAETAAAEAAEHGPSCCGTAACRAACTAGAAAATVPRRRPQSGARPTPRFEQPGPARLLTAPPGCRWRTAPWMQPCQGRARCGRRQRQRQERPRQPSPNRLATASGLAAAALVAAARAQTAVAADAQGRRSAQRTAPPGPPRMPRRWRASGALQRQARRWRPGAGAPAHRRACGCRQASGSLAGRAQTSSTPALQSTAASRHLLQPETDSNPFPAPRRACPVALPPLPCRPSFVAPALALPLCCRPSRPLCPRCCVP